MTGARWVMIVLGALTCGASPLGRAWGAEVCATIAESVDDDGAHMFKLSLSADTAASVSVRFQGPGFTSASMGGDLIQLDPAAPKDVDSEGFDVSAGDDIAFDVRLFDRPLASSDEMKNPTGKPLATFAFHRKVAEGEPAPPPFAKQCRSLG